MIFDASTMSGLCHGIEAVINTTLEFDPSTRNNISQINDILAVDCLLPNGSTLTIYATGQAQGICLLSYCEQDVTTRISGSPLALLGLIKQPASLANNDVTLSGSAALLQTWQSLLQNLDIDWEDAISRILGDIAGPLTSKGFKQSAQWAKEQFNEQKRLLRECITEEADIFPSKAETEYLSEKVIDIKVDIDRLTAQVNALRQQLTEQDHKK